MRFLRFTHGVRFGRNDKAVGEGQAPLFKDELNTYPNNGYPLFGLGEMSKRISKAFAVTEPTAYHYRWRDAGAHMRD